jgi:dihydrofolate reductase
MRVSIIVAMDRRGLIGAPQGLPWHLPKDLRRFRAITLGKPIILGRRTFELIGKPLPGRLNIILSRRPECDTQGCPVARTFPEALTIAENYLRQTGGDEVMVIGGATVYAEALACWERCYLTVVEGKFEGDTYFPLRELLAQRWRPACEAEAHPADEKNQHPHSFHIIERCSGADHRAPRQGDSGTSAGAGEGKLPDEVDLVALLHYGTLCARTKTSSSD